MFTRFDNIEPRELISGFWVRFIHTPSQTFALFEIDKGARLPEHSHMHEQVSQVLEGEFELTIEGVSKVCKSGDVAVIASNSLHSGTALTSCKILDTFSPAREDYK